MIAGVTVALQVAEFAGLLSVTAIGRLTYRAWRTRSEQALLSATELDDARTDAERFLDRWEARILTWVAVGGLLVALTAAVVAVVL